MRSMAAVRAETDALSDKLQALEDERDGIRYTDRIVRGEREARSLDAGARTRADNLDRGIARIQAQLETLADETRAHIGAIARSGDTRNMVDYTPPTFPGTPLNEAFGEHRGERPWSGAIRSAALRTIEAHRELTPDAGNRLDALVRSGVAEYESRYLTAVGDPQYLGAFTTAMRDPQYAHLRFTAAQKAAFDKVEEVRGTAMGIATDGIGGFALPFVLDPSIQDTSAGAACPLRELADVRVLTQNEQHFVSADGVVTQYQAEAAAVPEAGPTLTQPTLTAARGSAFVSASIEMIQDDPNLVAELVRMIATGKDTLEATKFLAGSGTNEPLGILTVGTPGALTNTQRVVTVAVDAVAADDVYALRAALDPRFQANARWAMHPNTYAHIYRMGPDTTTPEPALIESFGGPILGRAAHDWSTMDGPAGTVFTSTDNVAIYGDFRQGVIVGDRLGMSVEIIPHIFALAAGSRPTGQRGLVVWFRNGVVVRNPNALRFLQIG